MIIDHIGKVIEHRPINALAETLLTNEEARFGPVKRLISHCCQSRYQKLGHHQYLIMSSIKKIKNLVHGKTSLFRFED